MLLALCGQVSIDLVLRCSDPVIPRHGFSSYVSIVYALKQVAVEEH